MTRLQLLVLTLALSLVASAASAQRRTTIGFETQCDGSATPGVFLGGYKQVSSTLFAPCGIASIASGGLTGQQQLAQNGLIPLIGNIPGITGSVALAGAFNASTFGDVVIVFSPPINELSFDVLSVDNANGLKVSLAGALGQALPPIDNPTASGGIIHYARTSSTPIARATLSYTPVPLIGDGWFVDQLSFNAWVCGDGETDQGEACDDGNGVFCDGCNTRCQTSIAGCFDGASCIPPGTTSVCQTCNASTPPSPGGDIPPTPVAMNTPCDDGMFCTLPGACDGAGACKASPNTCDDGVVCTVDTCDETNDQCLHPIADKWCLINGSCTPNGNPNPNNVCQLCSSTKSSTSWDQKPTGTQCGDPSCSNGTAVTAALCTDMGVCQAGSTQSCMFMTCANTITCDGRCKSDSDCPRQAYCDTIGEVCIMDQNPATACSRDGECASNFCSDGVCCDKACTGACESCNQKDKVGVCSVLPAMTVDPVGLCGKGQVCSSTGACMIPPPPEPDGGVMMMPPPTGGTQPIGSSCELDGVCSSGVCSDGVCCDRTCSGICESCAAPGQPVGQCTPFALGIDPDNECGGTGGVCNGTSACTSYETRGNGLCTAAPGVAGHAGALTAGALVALATLLARRRRLRKGT